jgi:single-stranded-DNA-specific exonuclease
MQTTISPTEATLKASQQNQTSKAKLTSKSKLPLATIKERAINQALMQQGVQQGLAPILAKLIAARPTPPVHVGATPLDLFHPKLSKLSDPSAMVDIDKAAARVGMAIMNGECIGLETDHDCDGQTAHAILYYNLAQHFRHPAEKIKSYIGHRLEEGYGLSQKVADRILADSPRPTVIITADNGSSDEARIAQLKAQNIDVIVTDHHQIPKEGIPKSAYACLNPTRPDCNFGDPYIAGCMVAWLLMVKVRSYYPRIICKQPRQN